MTQMVPTFFPLAREAAISYVSVFTRARLRRL